jgi:hypothetical protein
MKNMISTHTKDFCEKHCPNLPIFENNNFEISKFLQNFIVGSSQNEKGFLRKIYFHIKFITKFG